MVKFPLLFGALVAAIAPGMALADWPERPVSIIVPAGAGGGTDSTARMLAERLQARFGVPFNVVNQGQGGGVVGITSIKEAEADGYTIGVIYNFGHYKPMGQADFNVDDFTPIAQYNFDPAGFHVSADNDWGSITEALDAIKAAPADYSISCGGGCGGSWPIALATLLNAWDVDMTQVRMIAGQGAAGALQDMVAGGFDVVPSSVPEAGPLIDAGRVKGLAVFGAERLAAFPDIPTLKEETGLDNALGAWRGVVAPAGLDADIAAQLEAAMQEIVADDSWREQMTGRGFGIEWKPAADFEAFMRGEEDSVREIVGILGL
ncbi:tripartite tricarboxylate transporter substrate binding protein [Jannaschia sp. M317]|uniref:Bug family tripartite tricarboxylate transporter substrate binding protein n=1 Tax=Jannaschia sp. M317 TaxID=2867011 RepID=UPI0021A60A97|nr:tripartite tricarboxylate transporter substrate binding protein [Jannaschia sp. M317]UWQ17908.1 tripartite tricarboxylate transporter substrate binding protein [Jannaschia sp. M317]